MRNSDAKRDAIVAYYDESYFVAQRAIGQFSMKASLFLFEDYIRPSDRVVDFGCGGGYLLSALDCAQKLGVEINPAARRVADTRGVPTVADLTDVPDGWADVVMSNHALEHMSDPFDKAVLVSRKLKRAGRAVFVVPCERHDTRYAEDDYDRHLYTWAPANLGNLFRHAGYKIESCERILHRWPPRATLVQRLVGWPLFHVICRTNARLFRRLCQVRVVAKT